jgi:small subunit ribosomal protein S6
MKQYECTFIIDPVLSGDEIKQTANMYLEHIKTNDCEIVHFEEMGVRELAYSINKRNAGVYFTIEFTTENTDLISELELAFRRDDRVLRYLTLSLEKHGIKYNQDKRAGLIGKRKEIEAAARKKKEEEKENAGA